MAWLLRGALPVPAWWLQALCRLHTPGWLAFSLANLLQVQPKGAHLIYLCLCSSRI